MRRLLLGLGTYMFAYFVIMELMLVAAVLYWPNFADNVEALRLMAPIPVLKDLVDTLEDTGVIGYVTGQQFFKGCNTLGTAAAVLFAIGAVAGEVHRGTLEILLARPFSRGRILFGRWAAGAFALVVPVFLSSATIPWLADRVDEQLEYMPLMLCSAHQSLFLLTIYTATFFLSSIGSNPTRIAVTMLFLTTFEFAIYMVKKVTHWSLFRLTDVEDFIRIYDTGRLDWSICGWLVVATAVLYAASHFAFRRRVP